MAHISGLERSQLLLLPEAVDDYVGSDNPVRFIDAFVDGIDLIEAGFGRVQPKATGRPGYAPGDLLKLYIYGYLNRVRSSRRLEAECHRNIEVIWLLRTLKPDFKTIADFRADNRTAFKSVFRQFTLLCKRLDLFGRELLAVDGTRIKAGNNKDRNFTRNSLEKFIKAADERLADYLRRLDEGDAAEKATSGARVKNLAEKIEALRKKRGQYDVMLKQLERTGEDQISLTDPDSRAMAAHTRVAVGYNIQVAVDAKHKLIVEQEVTNQVVDMGLLQATAEPAREILEVEKIDVVADKGYFNGRHRRLRKGGADASCAQTPTRLFGQQWLLPQGRVLLRSGAGRIRLSGRSRTEAAPPWQVARDDQGRLRQPGGAPRLPATPALHRRRLSRRLASRARGRARPHGGPPEGEAGNSRPPSRDGRTSVRQHQEMDESGRVPDARPGKRARRIQPDSARLQFAASAQHSQHGQDDGGRRRLTEAQIALFRGKTAHGGPPMPSKRPSARFQPETREKRRPERSVVASFNPVEFSHGLPRYCTTPTPAGTKRSGKAARRPL